jgi:hypothetical protein
MLDFDVRSAWRLAAALLISIALAMSLGSCDEGVTGEDGGGLPDASSFDAGHLVDGGPAEAGPADAGPADAGPPNTAPFVEGDFADLEVVEDGSVTPISFFVGDHESGLHALTVRATSSDAAIIPPSGLSFSSVGPRYTLEVALAPDAHGGPVTLTIIVDDGDLLATASFDVLVTPVNDPPSFTAGEDLVVAVNGGEQSFEWATLISPGPANESDQELVFEVTAADPAFFDAAPSIDAETGILSLGLADGRFGATTLHVRAVDDGGTDDGGVDTSEAVAVGLEAVCTLPPPAEAFLQGSYLMEQLSGQDPLFDSETFGDTQVVEIAGTGHERFFDFLYYPGIFNSDYRFTMLFCDGQVMVRGTINAGGLGCGSNIGFSTGAPPASYSLDDAVIPVHVTDFDPNGRCDEAPYQVRLRFTRQ